MSKGTVKWFNTRRGYGFITPEVGSKDVFFHVTKVQEAGVKQLTEGRHVGFDTYDDRGRTAAGNLRILN